MEGLHLTPEEYRTLLTELATDGLDPSRQVEIHSQLAHGINELFEEKNTLSSNLISANEQVNKHRDAMALMYSQLHAQSIKGSVEEEEQINQMEVISVNDLLANRKHK